MSANSRALPGSSRLTSAILPSFCSMKTQTLCFSAMVSSPHNVFFNQLFDHRRDALFGGGDFLAFGRAENDGVHLMDLGGRPRQSDSFLFGADILGVPNGEDPLMVFQKIF